MGGSDGDAAEFTAEHPFAKGFSLLQHIVIESVSETHWRLFCNCWDDAEFPLAFYEDNLLVVDVSCLGHFGFDGIYDLTHIWSEVIEA